MASNPTFASTPPVPKTHATRVRSHSKSPIPLRIAVLLLALVAVLTAFGIVIGLPRWHANVVRHADTAHLRSMCADKTDVPACTVLAQRMIAARSPEEAVEPLRAAVTHVMARPASAGAKESATLYGTLAEVLMLAGHGDEANSYFTRAIKQYDECVPAHLAFAFWLEGLHNHELAKNELKIVTTLDPHSDMAWFLLAHIYNGENSLKQARECALKAIAINPKMPNFWQELGDSDGYAGHYRDSLPAYREELRLDPTSVAAQADMARALALGANTPQEYEEALTRMLHVMRIKDLEVGPAYYLLGTLHLKFGHYKEARAALEKCVRYDGTLPENFYSLSQARKLCGDRKGAAEAMAHFNLMEKHFRHTQTLQKQLSERSNEPDLHIEVAKEWEWYHNWPDALREYQTAAKLKPNDAGIQQKIREISSRLVNRSAAPVDPAVSQLMNVNHAVVLRENHGAPGYPAPRPAAAPSDKP